MDYVIFWLLYAPFSILWHMDHTLGDKAIDLFAQFAETGLGKWILEDALIRLIDAMHALGLN